MKQNAPQARLIKQNASQARTLFLFSLFFFLRLSFTSIPSLEPRPPLARYSRSCSWTCLLRRLCLTARSVSICFHYQMLALRLRLDLLVSGGLVEDDHHARSLEDGIFCHLVAVSIHITFRVSMPPHLLSVRAPPHLPRMAVCVTNWPKFGTSCIASDVGDYMRLVIAVCPAYGGKTWPDCPSVPGFSFPCF